MRMGPGSKRPLPKRPDVPKMIPSIFEEEDNPELTEIPSELSFQLKPPPSIVSESDLVARQGTGKQLRRKLVIASTLRAELPYAVIRIPPRGVALCGHAWVSVLRGVVHVHGAILTPESPPLFMHSPPSTAILIQHESGYMPKPVSKARQTEEHKNPDADAHISLRESLTFEFEDETVVLVSTTARWATSNVVCPDIQFTLPLWNLPPPLVRLFPGLHIPHPEVTPLHRPECWEEITKAVRTPRASRILVLGSRGSGKSTIARSIVNHIVSTQPRGAMYMESDVSRPDRGIHGLIAAHRVHHPSTSQMSACRAVPFVGRLYGDATPRDDPEHYHKCMMTVAKRAVLGAARERVPLVCNTHGWMSGDGLTLIRELIEMVKPTLVVIMTLRLHTAADDAVNELVNCLPDVVRVIRVEPMPVPHRPHQHVVAERDMIIGSYFCNEMTLGRARLLYSIEVAIVTEPGGRGGRLDGIGRYPLIGLVGGLVALGLSPRRRWRREDDMMKVEIVGFAVVRGIDGEASKLYLASPVPGELLQLTSCLIIPGSVQTPTRVFSRASSVMGWDQRRRATDGTLSLPPFKLTGSTSTAAPMRSRTNLNRGGPNAGRRP